MKKTNKKNKITINQIIRRVIQIGFFLWMPGLYASAYSGVKYLFRQMGMGQLIEYNSFLSTFVWLCIFTILFGRIFCGYACAFGTLGDWVYALSFAIRKKMGKKPFAIPEKYFKFLRLAKYAVLLFTLTLCFLGMDGSVQKASPWDAFSMIRAGKFDGIYWAGMALLLAILAGMFVQERFFCQFLCPLGAIFSLLPVLPVFALSRKKSKCIRGCKACHNKCPMHISLSYEDGEDGELMGECIQCGKCADICPKGNICQSILNRPEEMEEKQA